MISRRGLLGALVGLPFAAKVALGAPVPKRPPEPTTFSQQRIEDFAQASLLYIHKHMRGNGIKPTSDVDNSLMGGPHGYQCLILDEDCIQNMDFLLQTFVGPAAHGLTEFLHRNNRSQCRRIGIEILRHPEGLILWICTSQHEKVNWNDEALYTGWKWV